MRTDFRQGIINYPSSLGQQTFLTVSGSQVSLHPNGQLNITFAHGTENYLYVETTDVVNAWDLITPSIDNWLYWELDPTTGIRRFGTTIVAPVTGATAPTGVDGLHWFNTTNNKMYWFKYHIWQEVVRVFAAKVNNTTFAPLGSGIAGQPYAGTQVGLNVPNTISGRIVTDSVGKAIVRQDGTILTTDNDLFINSSYANAVRAESRVFYGSAAESISQYRIVKVAVGNKISLANYNDTQLYSIAVAMEHCAVGQVGLLSLRGVITNPGWNFTTVGVPLWIADTGLLTEIDPYTADPSHHPVNKPPVAMVLTPVSVYFDPTLGGKGAKGNTALNASLASDLVYGLAKTSVAPVDPAHVVWVGNNDSRLTPYTHPATHPATMITTNAYGMLTGGNLQLQLDQLADRPLSSLSDVLAASPLTNQFITYNGTKWISTSISPVQTIDNLLDVSIVSPTVGQVLTYNGTSWTNTSRADTTLSGDVTGTGLSSIATTLATVNLAPGSYGSATNVAVFTVNEKGLVTSASNIPLVLSAAVPSALFTWGYGLKGSVGNNLVVNTSTPALIGTDIIWKQVSHTDLNGAAIKSDGTLWVWGNNEFGQLGQGYVSTVIPSPIQVGTDLTWSQVTCGYDSVYAIKTDGTLWAWGSNVEGQLGIGSLIHQSSPVQVGAFTDWTRLTSSTSNNNLFHATGARHVSAVRGNGTLWRWGLDIMNISETPIYLSSPVQVGVDTTWATTACGNMFASAIKTDGTMWTWGMNTFGQLGDGTVITKSSPVQIGSLTNWKQVACGYAHGAAIATDGTLSTWGYNFYGQLGDGTTVDKSFPIQIGARSDWTQVSCTNYTIHTLATNSTLWTCGYNYNGQLGDGTINLHSSPVQVGATTNWIQISGSSAIGTPVQGTITSINMVGDPAGLTVVGGPITSSGTFTLQGIEQIAHGGTGATTANSALNNLAPSQGGQGGKYLTTNGTNTSWAAGPSLINVSAWGTGWSFFGQLGSEPIISNYYSSPMQMGTSADRWSTVVQGYRHGLAIKMDGSLWTYGDNYYGELGHNNNTIKVYNPTRVGTSYDWAYAVGGYFTSFAIKKDGTLWAWGLNDHGQLGIGNATHKSSPVQVGSLNTWKQIACADGMTAGLQKDGTLWIWGFDYRAPSGPTVQWSSPIQIGALTDWSQIACAYGSVHGIKNDGTLWTFGLSSHGILGDGTNIQKSSPVQIGALNTWKTIAGGYFEMGATKTDGTLWTWGYNPYGALGIGDVVDRSVPTQVGSLTNWKYVQGGYFHMAGLKTDGTIWAWGRNNSGQLGQNDFVDRSSPVQIGSLTNWISISSGGGETVQMMRNDGITMSTESGGTGATDAASALAALLPPYHGPTNYVLTTDGTNVNWALLSSLP